VDIPPLLRFLWKMSVSGLLRGCSLADFVILDWWYLQHEWRCVIFNMGLASTLSITAWLSIRPSSSSYLSALLHWGRASICATWRISTQEVAPKGRAGR
jgi:hypothetical protein